MYRYAYDKYMKNNKQKINMKYVFWMMIPVYIFLALMIYMGRDEVYATKPTGIEIVDGVVQAIISK